MSAYVLDTSALLTLRDDETGADDVATLLRQAQAGKCRCLVSFMSLMEIYYRVWQDEGRISGHLAYEQCKSLPVEVVHESEDLLVTAARLKATHRLSVADAWIAATAALQGATLVHKDPEFAPLALDQRALPYR